MITAWAKQWKMKFNPDISKQAVEIVLSSKYKKPNHPPISFGGIPVARVESTKRIDLILDQRLSFKEHILESIEKFVNRKILDLTYIMHACIWNMET